MAYESSISLPHESASKLGHLSIINNDFIRELVNDFEKYEDTSEIQPDNTFNSRATDIVNSINSVITVDGSCSTIINSLNRKKSLAYIKIASLLLNIDTLQKANKPVVDPDLIHQILTKYSDTYSTVLPLNNIKIKGYSPLDTIRKIINITIKTHEQGMLYDTLKYLLFRKWQDTKACKLNFSCPICKEEINIETEQDEYICNSCANTVFLTDYISLHMELNDDYNNESLAMSFMHILEHLLYISFLRVLYENNNSMLSNVILLKDGPLALHSQYSRLVEPIREFIQFLRGEKIVFFMAGIEKTGTFAEHASLLNRRLKNIGDYFIPDNKYIFSNIKHGDPNQTKYGERVLYGSKLFVKIDNNDTAVICIPTGNFVLNPSEDDLVGFDNVIDILLKLRSKQHSNALLPIVAVNNIASMSVYPTNNILKKFTETTMSIKL